MQLTTTTPPLDIPALLDATCDLEVGHPIDAVLRAHGRIPTVVSAYEVMRSYANALNMAERRKERPDRQSYWAETLRPCVAAIAEWFADNPQL